MPSDCELAKNDFIEKKDILKIPLIFHRRAGLQQLISNWADTDIKNFNIAATYVVCFVSTKDAGKVFFTY